MRYLMLGLVLFTSLAFADDGSMVYQAGGVAYVFPWRLCLIISAALSLGVYALRK